MRTPTSRTESGGFTLVELMLVIMIVGVVSAIVVVRLDRTLPGHRLRSAATEIMGLDDIARSESRLKGAAVSLTYDLDHATVTLTAPPPPPPEAQAGEAPPAYTEAQPEPDVTAAYDLPAGVRIAGVYYGENGVVLSGTVIADFRPNGAVGEHMVILEESGGDRTAVFVPALVGTAFVVQDGTTYDAIRSARRAR